MPGVPGWEGALPIAPHTQPIVDNYVSPRSHWKRLWSKQESAQEGPPTADIKANVEIWPRSSLAHDTILEETAGQTELVPGDSCPFWALPPRI